MIDWFLNPGYLAAAAALVSLPILIHLINRMRYKRVRWAAMEFLLKAQKRMRRRLIIEQLLLLLLRCLLVALAGLLVMRFVGFSFSDFAGKQGLHLVLLDDTLSMTDSWKENGVPRTSFQVAKDDIVLGKIAAGLGATNASDKFVLLPMSRFVEPDFEMKAYERLGTAERFKELKADVDSLEPRLAHVPLPQVVKRLQEIVNSNLEHRITLHVVSDFRYRDWAKPHGDPAHDALKAIAAASKDFKIRLIDVAHPYWVKGQADPLSHDNVGIVDFRPLTKVVGRDMPVAFAATLTNFSSRETEVRLRIFDEGDKSAERADIDFNLPMPLRMSPNSSVVLTFDMRFNPTLKPNESHFAQISARLKSPQLGELENDGLSADNVRFAAVEVRDKVPVLVIDGEGKRSRTEFDKDSFYVQAALQSVPGASFEMVWGDELGGGLAVKALERPDLHRYPSIFLLNVRELNPKQLANLEAYAREGGGVCFFLGPQVSAKHYNEKLYNEGKGMFPMPLRDAYTPPANEDPRKPEVTGLPQVLLREESFGSADLFPIFGQVFKDPRQKAVLRDLPVRRYFSVPRANWRPEAGKTFELATLPNEAPIATYQGAVVDLTRKWLDAIVSNDEFKAFRKSLAKHRAALETLVAPGSDKLAHQLAPAIDAMLNDPGDKRNLQESPNLADFWNASDPKVASLKEQFVKLRDQVRYGDPLVVASQFGKGKVVVVTTTAGKEWSDWAGGSEATLVYQPFLWELQNYLSSQSADENRSVGGTVSLAFDAEAFKGKSLSAERVYHKVDLAKDAAVALVKEGQTFPKAVGGSLVFEFPRNERPGLYVTTVSVGETKAPLASVAHVFNVDSAREGNLERVRRDEIQSNVVGDLRDQIQFEGPGVGQDSLVTRMSDFSESPWLYLIFLFVLVAEQALAVHLSFHLKGSENELLAKLTPK